MTNALVAPQTEPDHVKSESPPNPQRLHDLLGQILKTDKRIQELLDSEALDEAAVLEEADRSLSQGTIDFESKLEDLDKAEQTRDDALTAAKDPWYVNVAAGFIVIGLLGYVVLLAIGIAKWTGHLLQLPIWPFVTVPTVLVIAGSLLINYSEQSSTSEATPATSDAERLRSTLRDQLRSLVLIPAIEQVTSLQFLTPSADDVWITDARWLSSRVEAAGRIQTGSYRDVLTGLSRTGGATIGLAGSRGIGKSELLRAFCAEPTNPASVEAGGTIGIIVPAPVAYEAIDFLRVIIRRLAEAVPDFKADAERTRGPMPTPVELAVLFFAALAIAAGAALATGLTKHDRSVLGWVLVGIGVVVLGAALVRLAMSTRFGSRLIKAVGPAIGIQVAGVALDFRFGDGGRKDEDTNEKETRINRRTREELAVQATKLAQRIRFVESRSTSTQASTSVNGVGFSASSGVNLDQVPYTEADLVIELSNVVDSLRQGGYEIRIGIDELDKLVDGDDAMKFMTGMKVLFPIRHCSFLLSISENASAQFARRGMPIRDVFDSSLDSVIIVQPLSFNEARRLVRGRQRSVESEKMSDAQVLLCHCLSGGLPRDFLRYCRQLGEVNSKLGGHCKLDVVTTELLETEVRTRLDGVRSAMLGRDEDDDAAAVFVAELELIEQAFHSDQVVDQLNLFLQFDRGFGYVCKGGPTVVAAAAQSSTVPTGSDWIRTVRRQVYAHLFLIDTTRGAFLNQLGPANTFDVVTTFELISSARRKLEFDTAAGWRGTADARVKLGLPAVS